MPIIKSAKKRVRVAEKASINNSKTKRSLRDSVKAFHETLTAKKDTTKLQNDAYSAIDTAVKKGVISKNRAARKKAQLNRASKAAGTTKVGAKKSKTATTTKKPLTKKAPVKKPAVKKTTAKKAK
jgi:small subunit ribosomal protein S20